MKTIENIKAKKSLGQNFLTDSSTLMMIASFFDVSGKNIVEVGPGYGALTEHILQQKPASLFLVELDRDMVEILEERKEKKELEIGNTFFKIFHEDVLSFEPDFGQGSGDYIVIANIPYYITSPILRRFLYEVKHKPEKMLILMQKEVGEKILLGTGTQKKSSVLSLFIAKKASAKKVASVPAHFFRPAPKVDSMVIAFERDEKGENVRDEIFFEYIKKAFSEPRKKLSSNLKKAGYDKEKLQEFFEKNSIDENARPENLSIQNYLDLILFLEK